MKIYDCFPFYNELDILDLKLKELYDHVDKFVIVECTTTFQSTPKKLYLKENWDRYAAYHDKIIHVIVDDAPGDPDAWVNDIFQRNAIMRGLDDADPDDIIIVEDCDEILRPEIIDHIRANPTDIMGFRQAFFNFKMNYMLVNHPESYHVWTVACRRKFLEKPDAFRYTRFQLTQLPYGYEDDNMRMYEHAGWHFTYFGDDNWIRNKLKSFAHTELNNDYVLERIDVNTMIEKGVGFNPVDPRSFVKIAVDEFLPKTITNNLEKYQEFLLPGEAENARQYFPQ